MPEHAVELMRRLLVAHVGCRHDLQTRAEIGTRAAVWWAHHDGHITDPVRVHTDERPAAERGSAIFHALARTLLALPGHKIVPLTITDEQYAQLATGGPDA